MTSELNRARTAAVMRAIPSGPGAKSHSISALDPGRLPLPTQSLPGRPEISTKEVEEESGDTDQERLDAAYATAVARAAVSSREKDIDRGYGIPPIHGGAFTPPWAESHGSFRRYWDLAKEGGVLEGYEPPMGWDHGLSDHDFTPTTELREPVVDYIQYQSKEGGVL